MTNVNTKTNAEKINRLQNLRAMERLMITMGGKDGLMAWMAAMPDDVVLSSSGGVSAESMMDVANRDDAYQAAVQAFAAHMTPVLAAIAAEV